MLDYGYGIDAIRTHGRGAQSVGMLVQFDFGKKNSRNFNSAQPSLWHGWMRIFD
jgi:hypothetical protein